MDNYVISQLLLGVFIPDKRKNIIILKARGSFTNRIASELMMIAKENPHIAVIGTGISDSIDMEGIKKFEDYLKDVNMNDTVVIHTPNIVKLSPFLSEVTPNPIDLNVFGKDEDNHKFISKNSGGHIVKPGTKKDRAFRNEFNKNSYRKKRRK